MDPFYAFPLMPSPSTPQVITNNDETSSNHHNECVAIAKNK